MEEKIIKLKIIENYIKRIVSDFKRTLWIENYRNRIDELLLLYSKLEDISFVESCKKFGVDYELFNELTNYDPKNMSQVEALNKLISKLK